MGLEEKRGEDPWVSAQDAVRNFTESGEMKTLPRFQLSARRGDEFQDSSSSERLAVPPRPWTLRKYVACAQQAASREELYENLSAIFTRPGPPCRCAGAEPATRCRSGRRARAPQLSRGRRRREVSAHRVPSDDFLQWGRLSDFHGSR